MKHVGISVAVGNGSDKTKQAADYITSDIDDDDTEKALRYFQIIE